MDDYIHHDYTLTKSKWKFRPLLLPQLKINFNFYINLQTSNLVVDQDLTTLLLITPGPSTPTYHTSAAVKLLRGSSSCDDIVRQAVGHAIAGTILDGDRRKLMELVVEEVRNKFRNQTSLPKSGIFYADLTIKANIYNISVGDDDYDDHHGMVPAADSSIGLLEKCEVDRDDHDVTSCSICMEDLGAAAASRLPCSHAFHGGCIQKWLYTSHYCPLCRYELPTQ